MKVYVVERYYHYETSDVLEVFKTKDSAKLFLYDYMLKEKEAGIEYKCVRQSPKEDVWETSHKSLGILEFELKE